MRDLLTAFAVLVIAVLTAALAVPPLIDWGAHRSLVEEVLGHAVGTQATTEGRIVLRILPSPRVRIERLRLGPDDPDEPSLTAAFLRAELALAPLLRGEMRFEQVRIGRAEIRVPVDRDGIPRLPGGLPPAGAPRDMAVENLSVAQLLVTTVTPATGRTDQLYAERVRIAGPSLAGPWRVEGLAGAVPFRLVTGTPGADGSIPIRLAGGGDLAPRFDIDAKLAFTPKRPGVVEAGLSGAAKVLFGPPAQAAAAGLPVPVAVQASFTLSGRTVNLDPLTVEAGEGATSLRFGGTGSIRLYEPRVSLRLDSKRIDLDSFILSAVGRDLKAQAATWSPPPLPLPVDLDLTVASIGLAEEELTDFKVRGTLARGQAALDRIEVAGPGQTRVALAGTAGLSTEGGANGRITVVSGATDRLGRYLGKLGLPGPFLALLDGGRLDASAEAVVALPVVSFRNARVALGDASATGNVRVVAPEAGSRGRIEAQIAVQGLDLDALPRTTSLFEATRTFDLGLMVAASGLRYGAQAGTGRIAAHVESDGPELVVRTLDVADLAGASARIGGRIAPDGSGRITGKVRAVRAAPIIDLVGRIWIGGVSRLVPGFLREGGLDLDVAAERAGGSGEPALLHTTVRGTAAGGRFEADVLSAEGRTERLGLRLATDDTSAWLKGLGVAALRRPSRLELKGVRVFGQFNMTVFGDVGGIAVSTTRPFALGPDDDSVDSGEADLVADDASPFLAPFRTPRGAGAGPEPPVPARLHVVLGREGGAPLVAVSGRLADDAIQADLAVRSAREVSGTVNLDRLSLPWLAAVAVLQPVPEARPGPGWSAARFGPERGLDVAGQVAVKVRRLDLGRGFTAGDAAFGLAFGPGGLAISDLAAALAGGRIAGMLRLTRQGPLAAVDGEGTVDGAALRELAGAAAFGGRLSAKLRFGASGDSLAALVASLSGGGEVSVGDLEVPDADAGAVERVLGRAATEADPLAAGRLQALVVEELGRGPLRAQLSAPATLVGGTLRMSPAVAEAGTAVWQGAVAFDAGTMALSARGTLGLRTAPPGWIGSPPHVGLGWSGTLAAPAREVDVGALLGGVAALVLQRELDRIEALDAGRAERGRRPERRSPDPVPRERQGAAGDGGAAGAPEARSRSDGSADAARGPDAARDTGAPGGPPPPTLPSGLPHRPAQTQ